MIQRYLDDFSYDHYISYMEILLKMPSWEKVNKVLTDARFVNPDEALTNMQKLVKYREEVIKRNYLNVFLVTEPLATAITHLYQGALARKDFNYQYCSTIQMAGEYLATGIKEKDLNKMLNNLTEVY